MKIHFMKDKRYFHKKKNNYKFYHNKINQINIVIHLVQIQFLNRKIKNKMYSKDLIKTKKI